MSTPSLTKSESIHKMVVEVLERGKYYSLWDCYEVYKETLELIVYLLEEEKK